MLLNLTRSPLDETNHWGAGQRCEGRQWGLEAQNVTVREQAFLWGVASILGSTSYGTQEPSQSEMVPFYDCRKPLVLLPRAKTAWQDAA